MAAAADDAAYCCAARAAFVARGLPVPENVQESLCRSAPAAAGPSAGVILVEIHLHADSATSSASAGTALDTSGRAWAEAVKAAVVDAGRARSETDAALPVTLLPPLSSVEGQRAVLAVVLPPVGVVGKLSMVGGGKQSPGGVETAAQDAARWLERRISTTGAAGVSPGVEVATESAEFVSAAEVDSADTTTAKDAPPALLAGCLASVVVPPCVASERIQQAARNAIAEARATCMPQALWSLPSGAVGSRLAWWAWAVAAVAGIYQAQEPERPVMPEPKPSVELEPKMVPGAEVLAAPAADVSSEGEDLRVPASLPGTAGEEPQDGNHEADSASTSSSSSSDSVTSSSSGSESESEDDENAPAA